MEMSIANMSVAMNMAQLQNEVGVAIMKNVMDHSLIGNYFKLIGSFCPQQHIIPCLLIKL